MPLSPHTSKDSRLPDGWTAPILDDRGNDSYRLLRALRGGLMESFSAAVEDPAAAQRGALARVLQAARGTEFGRRHGLAGVRTLSEYREAVPIRGFDGFAEDLGLVAGGRPRTLTAHPVTSLVKTSGTTGEPKLLPVTGPWARVVAEAQAIWTLAMVREQEEITTGRALTTVGPAVEGRAPGGLPYGSNTGRMHLAQPWLVRRRYAVPYEVFTLGEPELRHYCLLRLALVADVRTWTTANPSTVLALARALNRYREPLERDLADGTLCHGPAAELPRTWRWRWTLRLGRKRIEDWRLGRIWDLAAINCWKGGAAPFFIDHFRDVLGRRVRVREVGISASEGYFAIPLHSSWTGGVAWAAGHLLELVDHQGTVWSLEDVPIGCEARLVISTTAGLYRYDLNDIVRVVGRYGNAPVLAFVGKGSDVLSVTGEKVTAEQVAIALSRTTGQTPAGFSVGVHMAEVPAYVLAAEGGVVDIASFERELRVLNPEYDQKRSSDRLAPAKLVSLPADTYARYRAARLRDGAADGQVKDPILVTPGVLERLQQGWR